MPTINSHNVRIPASMGRDPLNLPKASAPGSTRPPTTPGVGFEPFFPDPIPTVTTRPVSTGSIGAANDSTLVGVRSSETTVVDYNRPLPASRYEIDVAKVNAQWPGEPPVTKVADLFSKRVQLGPNAITVPTHIMGDAKDIRLIAYDNAQGVDQKDLLRFVAPGEVMIAIKHHSVDHRALTSEVGKEAMKFDSTHIELVVGVETKDEAGQTKPGVMTLNNPQNYEGGLFGDASYPMIFTRLTFPESITPEQKQQYMNNLRTWLVIANTFTDFPGNYNGGDPLGTRSVEQVKTLGDKLLGALAGDAEAKAWLKDPANKVYCAELAHVATNLGVHYPLNKKHLGERYESVKSALASGEFLQNNGNAHAAKVKLEMAPGSLTPITEKLGVTPTPVSPDKAFGDGLAFQPFTMADLVEQFVKDHLPRAKLGEATAPAQGEVLKAAKPGLLEATGLDKLPAEDPRRVGAEQLFDQIVAHVSTPAPDGKYSTFRAGLAPLLEMAKKAAGPRDDGTGAFVPPHLFLQMGKGSAPSGLLGVEYVGHGLHSSLLSEKAPS